MGDLLEKLPLKFYAPPEGFSGMERELLALKKLDKDQQKGVESLLEYLRKNKDRLHDAERWAAGRAMGSGLIEGACKNLVKRRKQTGACWRVPRASRIATLCATLYSNQWKTCWKNQQNCDTPLLRVEFRYLLTLHGNQYRIGGHKMD